ncbi:hypothetical protein MATR_00460 [Marivirga tractuosa]|uniref:Rad50/SbcC-type AAA domain-containing protein n=1 Tax=Marivirga tractuosa (strain ATCC 23168 / DSM 4126 / NBRC 15989 / NCIMB 1408 / VKM B-1430 / H-43) TaxID=643867 RepID=E4TLK8_MARTH|nr:hypothetical protein [Marivirga tractuosa]ADR22312.1 hypothetical protein Ftrac_2334 [Marivirga tractuosa DSM 4126]BDD13221.1 hypothetical protein MATR_00460 [Marivirga tractuosa]
MILKKLILENTGPIHNINHSFEAKDNVIKPLVLVGRNGSGKSIAISFIINSIIAGKQVIFDDVEVEKGKVYKLRSSNYIRNGEDFYHGKIELLGSFYCSEFQLNLTRKEFEEKLKYTPLH